ncbi:thioredoxin family protein [Flavobacterium sp. CS20]|uniref:thioredoxin family protein n=1 Tax=Flavobacterium sp. CS20 TaxID=2775246 RepID=UPI001B39D376|nr:thioredoxin family protein [Flavobacterium sp. CS20]QTY27424.1 thioredoxin family protein [Flavobacterium sp. CS20]
MKLYLSIINLLLLFNVALAQESNIIGQTNKNEILNSRHKSWFNKNYNSYEPSPKHIKQIKKLLAKNDYKIEVYFGTWCSDSQREVPRLIKILEASEFDFDNLKLVGVGPEKKVPNVSKKRQKQLNITNVPTIIVYQDDKEINRFVEYAQESLEKDFINILAKKPYKHSYQQ